MNSILWNLLVLSEVLLPAISNTCVPWWGFRQSNRSVGQRKSGQHMSVTSTQRTSWKWECSQCVTNKAWGSHYKLLMPITQRKRAGASQKGSWFLLVQRELWQHLIQLLGKFVLSSSTQMCPCTPWQRLRMLGEPLPEHPQLPGAATQVRVGREMCRTHQT